MLTLHRTYFPSLYAWIIILAHLLIFNLFRRVKRKKRKYVKDMNNLGGNLFVPTPLLPASFNPLAVSCITPLLRTKYTLVARNNRAVVSGVSRTNGQGTHHTASNTWAWTSWLRLCKSPVDISNLVLALKCSAIWAMKTHTQVNLLSSSQPVKGMKRDLQVLKVLDQNAIVTEHYTP